MINSDNLVILSGRLTRDAETIMDGKQVKFDVAIDNSGYEKGSDSRAGFFTCKAWLTASEFTPVVTQKRLNELVEQKLLLKGAPVRVVGAIHHERWSDDEGKRRSNVVVMIEDLTAYVARSKKDDAGGSETGAVQKSSSASDFDAPF